MTIDLANLDTAAACDKGAEIELYHPVTKAPLNVFFTVLGEDSAVFKNKAREFANARLRREATMRGRGKTAEVRSLEDSEIDNLSILAECTTGWRTGNSPTVTIDGRELPFSKKNAEDFYQRFPKFRDQIQDAITELENFLPK